MENPATKKTRACGPYLPVLLTSICWLILYCRIKNCQFSALRIHLRLFKEVKVKEVAKSRSRLTAQHIWYSLFQTFLWYEPLPLGEAVKGHRLIGASGMLPPKIRHILESFAFSVVFFAKRETLPRSNHILKMQCEIIF